MMGLEQTEVRIGVALLLLQVKYNVQPHRFSCLCADQDVSQSPRFVESDWIRLT